MDINEILARREDGELTVEDRKFLARFKIEIEVSKHLTSLLNELVRVKVRSVGIRGISEKDSGRLPEIVHQIESCREILEDIAAGRFVSFKNYLFCSNVLEFTAW